MDSRAVLTSLVIVLAVVRGVIADDKATAILGQIQVLESDGKLEEAADLCTTALQESPRATTRIQLLNARAYLRTELKQYEAALTDSDASLKISESVPETHCYRGYLFTRLKRYSDAIMGFSRALDLEPGCTRCFLWRAQAHAQFGFDEAAVKDYTAAIAQVHTAPDLYRYRAGQYFNMGDYGRAVEDLETYLRLVDAAFVKDQVYALLGLSQIHLGNRRDGWENISRSARLQGKTPADQAAKLAGLCFVAGLMEVALTSYDRAISMQPTNAVAFFERGQVGHIVGNSASAIVDFTRSIELENATNAHVYMWRAKTYLEKGDIACASNDYVRASAIDPGCTGLMIIAGLAGDRAGVLKAMNGEPGGSNDDDDDVDTFLWNTLLDGAPSEALRSRLAQRSGRRWPHPIVQFYSGKLTSMEVLKLAEHRNLFTRRDRLTKAHFFIGAKYLKDGDHAKAKECFTQAVASSPWHFPIERFLAQKELETHWLEKLLSVTGTNTPAITQ